MATTQEVLELVLKVQGQAEADKLQAILDAQDQASADLAAEVVRLNAAYAAGTMPLRDYASEMLKVEKAQEANQKTTKQTLDRYNLAAGGSKARTKDLSGALLEFSRAAEDAQYGIRGVLNNIPGLIQMLGLG